MIRWRHAIKGSDHAKDGMMLRMVNRIKQIGKWGKVMGTRTIKRTEMRTRTSLMSGYSKVTKPMNSTERKWNSLADSSVAYMKTLKND